MATTTKNICVAISYTDKKGEKKTMWKTIGKFFEGDKPFGIIDSIPIGWDGRFQLFNDDKKGGQQTVQPASDSPSDGLPF